MEYTLDEKNSERQYLLAKVLNPLTRPVLERAGVPAGARCLDLGCGQGNTTRLLWEVFNPAECVGLEYDAALVAQAAAHPENPAGIRFQQGDATNLEFADGSFDVVFCRYLLVHLPDPVAVIREMLRVAGRNGKVIAFEPDCATQIAYPPSWAIDRMAGIWDGLFADARIGRKLVSHFRAAGASQTESGAAQHLEYRDADCRRIYRLSMFSAEVPIKARGLLGENEFDELVRELERLEADPYAVVLKMPDIWVVASQ